nr:MAG TPA: hypothetical protein [Caudoviricetes sp.]
MIELKITAETASELTSEIQELAQQVVGTHLCDCQDGKLVEAPVVEAKLKVEEKPKKSKKASKPAEEKAETPAETEVKEDAPKAETPKEEAPKAEAETKSYKIDEVRGAVKDFVQANPDNKAKIATFLHDDLGVKSISEAPADVYPKIMEFVGATK